MSIPWEVNSHIFIAKLVRGEVNSSEGPPTNLLSDYILVDTMLGGTIVLAGGIFGAGVQCFLAVWSVGIHDERQRNATFTGRLARGFRCRCR